MKLALPFTIPTCVLLTRRFDFTMPKSDSFTSPGSDTMTLLAEMSRWTIPIGEPTLSRCSCA